MAKIEGNQVQAHWGRPTRLAGGPIGLPLAWPGAEVFIEIDRELK